jgi:leucyl aminopeptidase
VHIDIAGMAWVKSEKDACPKGAVGFGVKLLDKLVEEYYESK